MPLPISIPVGTEWQVGQLANADGTYVYVYVRIDTAQYRFSFRTFNESPTPSPMRVWLNQARARDVDAPPGHWPGLDGSGNPTWQSAGARRWDTIELGVTT